MCSSTLAALARLTKTSGVCGRVGRTIRTYSTSYIRTLDIRYYPLFRNGEKAHTPAAAGLDAVKMPSRSRSPAPPVSPARSSGAKAASPASKSSSAKSPSRKGSKSPARSSGAKVASPASKSSSAKSPSRNKGGKSPAAASSSKDVDVDAIIEELCDMFEDKNGRDPTTDEVKLWLKTLRDGTTPGKALPPSSSSSSSSSSRGKVRDQFDMIIEELCDMFKERNGRDPTTGEVQMWCDTLRESAKKAADDKNQGDGGQTDHPLVKIVCEKTQNLVVDFFSVFLAVLLITSTLRWLGMSGNRENGIAANLPLLYFAVLIGCSWGMVRATESVASSLSSFLLLKCGGSQNDVNTYGVFWMFAVSYSGAYANAYEAAHDAVGTLALNAMGNAANATLDNVAVLEEFLGAMTVWWLLLNAYGIVKYNNWTRIIVYGTFVLLLNRKHSFDDQKWFPPFHYQL